MRTSCRSLSIIAALGILTACGSGAPEETATESQRQQALRESTFGAIVEPMDDAAAVEQLAIDRKRELDEAIER